MISIVVVYNDKRSLNQILLSSLNKQTSKFELLALDNTKGRFVSAAEALNYGGAKGTGKYLMFVHQDVELDSESWLKKVEQVLDRIDDLGVAGVAGMSERGRTNRERGRGCISNNGVIWEWGNPVKKPQPVQTLDECLLIVPKVVFNKVKFDQKTFDYWHSYGVDYCLTVRKKGLKAYVIPAFVYHRSHKTNVKDLHKYERRLLDKHREYKRIFTCSGEVSRQKLRVNSLTDFIRPYYKEMFPDRVALLKREFFNGESVLDLGCGYDSPIQYCRVRSSLGVDLSESNLQESKKKFIHTQYIKADVKDILFKPKSFDVVMCLEVLDYLTKEEGYGLILIMEQLARGKVIISTLSGYLPRGKDENLVRNPKSSWSIEELGRLGFKTRIAYGWRRLALYSKTSYNSSFLWERVLELSQKFTHHFPKQAYQLLCVKDIGQR
ncbi:MAG: glycosyltransferase [Candidatus Atabeyarchaeum deiterrae]